MATLKDKKPTILPLKSDLVPVDRKKAQKWRVGVFGLHKEYSASSTNIARVGTALMEVGWEGGGGGGGGWQSHIIHPFSLYMVIGDTM